MTRVREEYDADRFGAREKTAEFPFSDRQFPVICGICGATRYVSQKFSLKIAAAVEEGDNPFVCERCERDFEEAAHAGR